jgi:signal peptidase I
MEQQAQAKGRNGIGKIKEILGLIGRFSWFISCSVAFILFIFLRKYFFDIKHITGLDMQSTYSFGDMVLIKKFRNDYKAHDAILFTFPGDSIRNVPFIQRIAGLPGDTIELKNKFVYINGFRISDTATVRHNYFIQTKKIKLDSLFLLRYNLNEGGSVSDGFDYCYALNQFEAFMVKRDSSIASVAVKSEDDNDYDNSCFPHHPHFQWNRDFYGPLYVPKKGDSLLVDSLNYILYANIISYENGDKTPEFDFNTPVKYCFKNNYYFVLGDNRDNANDSRTYGLVPARRIKGKVARVLKHAD